MPLDAVTEHEPRAISRRAALLADKCRQRRDVWLAHAADLRERARVSEGYAADAEREALEIEAEG